MKKKKIVNDKLEYWKCYRKRRYETKEQAEKTVEQLKREEKQGTLLKIKLSAFKCNICQGFHIGKSNRKDVDE